MAIIQEQHLFSWDFFAKDDIGDLARLQLVLENLPDEHLMQTLERHRSNGRDDYPVRPLWNSLIAKHVLQHSSIESLRRELSRNPLLRQVCGFDPTLGSDAVPPASVYSRFKDRLEEFQDLIMDIFYEAGAQLQKLLPDLGKNLSVDSDAIDSKANRPPKNPKILKASSAERSSTEESSPNPPLPLETKEGVNNQTEGDAATPQQEEPKLDRRQEHSADFGRKDYHYTNDDGSTSTKVTSWFGFKLHVVLDTKYGLPLSFGVTKASKHDGAWLEEQLPHLYERGIIRKGALMAADKAYDSKSIINQLFQKYGVTPLIDIRNMWKGGDTTKSLPNHPDIVYNYKGDVFCWNNDTQKLDRMTFCGFEKDRQTLKYKTPHEAYKLSGPSPYSCAKTIRIPLSTDERIFTSIARSSHKWKRLYKARTAVERFNNVIDNVLRIDHAEERGIGRAKLNISLAMCTVLGMALGRIHNKQPGLIRSIVKAA